MTQTRRERLPLLREMSAAESELNTALQGLEDLKHKSVFGWPARKEYRRARIARLLRELGGEA